MERVNYKSNLFQILNHPKTYRHCLYKNIERLFESTNSERVSLSREELAGGKLEE